METSKRKGIEMEGDVTKRQKGDEEEKIEPTENKKRPLILRVLVEKGDAGSLIGKGGATIKKFREDTGTQLDIDEALEGARKRVVTIRASYEQACQALYWIAERILERRKERNGKSEETDETNVLYDATLLVMNPCVGCIIGKAGATIRQIRLTSGADIKVSKTVLDGSSEKTIQIQGSGTQYDQAIRLTLDAIWENYDKFMSHRTSQSLYQPRPHHKPYAYDGYPKQGFSSAPLNPYTAGYGSSLYSSSPLPPPLPPSTLATQHNVTLSIPESCVGSVIGRAGATIEDIRARSGCQINVEKRALGKVDERAERKITITGPKQNTDFAAALVNQAISSSTASGQTSSSVAPATTSYSGPPPPSYSYGYGNSGGGMGFGLGGIGLGLSLDPSHSLLDR